VNRDRVRCGGRGVSIDRCRDYPDLGSQHNGRRHLRLPGLHRFGRPLPEILLRGRGKPTRIPNRNACNTKQSQIV